MKYLAVILLMLFGATAQAQSLNYLESYPKVLLAGITLTSTGDSSINDTYPLDANTQTNLTGYFLKLVGTSIIKATISNGSGGAGTTLNVTNFTLGPGGSPLAVGQYIGGSNGANVFTTHITVRGSGTGGTGTYTVADSLNITSEYMTAGGLGTGLPTGSAVFLQDTQGTLRSFTPIEFLNYENLAVGPYLNSLSPQAYAANGNAFPSSSNFTIP